MFTFERKGGFDIGKPLINFYIGNTAIKPNSDKLKDTGDSAS